MSISTDFFGEARPTLRCCAMESPEQVTVWPNMIWPMSMLTLRARFTASATCAAPEENLNSPSAP